MIINIRPIQESDFDELASIFLEFAAFQNVPEKMLNSAEKMRHEKEHIFGFIARDENNEIAGYVTYFFAYYTWVGKSLYMDDLFVREKYRGMRLGSRLINEVIDLAKKENCNRLRWQVSNWNHPAIKFYENLGAKIDDIERNCDLVF